jgi:tRNA(Ile)-lysidine synthase
MGKELDRRLADHLVSDRLFEPPGLALLAVSGGADSVALLDLMFCVAEGLGVSLAVAHVVHGISREAADAAPDVQRLVHSYRIPFYLEELELGPDATETVARQARYEALRTIQSSVGASYLVTAHHRDDQIETVLLRFLRGSGIAGLTGIPAQGPGGLVRPLLPFERDELLRWLSLRFPDPATRPRIFDDPANADSRHDRSWIRHHLLPLLRERFGESFDRRLLEVSVHAGEERLAWAAALSALRELDFHRESSAIEVARDPFQRYDKLLSQAVLRAAAREIGCRLGRTQTELLLEYVNSGSSGGKLHLGSEFEATLVFERLRIERTNDDNATPVAELQLLQGSEGSLCWDGWQFSWRSDRAEPSKRSSMTSWVTYGPCQIRPPTEGDRIRPIGGVGSRKVRRVLMEARIPAAARDRYPVIARGADVLWVPGICRSEASLPCEGEPAVRLEARAD